MKIFSLFFFFSYVAQASFFPKAFEAELEQQVKSSIGKNKVHKKNLKLKYQFPSMFHLTDQAADTLYICNQRKVWIYSAPVIEGEPGNLKIGNSSKYCYSKIFDALSKGLKSNKLYRVKKMKKSLYELVFQKKAKQQLGLDKLTILFKGPSLELVHAKRITLYYTGKKSPVALAINKIIPVKKFSQSLFSFKAPKNTEKIYMK